MQLDLKKHPVAVIDALTGVEVMYFTNFMSAARTVARSKTDISRRELAIKSADGKHYDLLTCRKDEIDWDYSHTALKGEMRI